MKNTNLTYLDNHQIERVEHDVENEARRMVLVNLDPELKKELYALLKANIAETKIETVPTIIKEIEIKEIGKEVPKWQMICIILQTVGLLGLLISHFIK